ncbi:hypothetical protein OOT33_12680 [Sphingobium sp. DEHP117]|uniref:hypothetical protein n=1 Tax=Sphingobium sp. DEHP117 TaxID=2993436 RepID=UPI0027D62811|nr:hypothetical protein [Sphingobium sp. DEHP117]MDQ4421276.1 hypothetical protein [Sphingobium sp. DEHP117]
MVSHYREALPPGGYGFILRHHCLSARLIGAYAAHRNGHVHVLLFRAASQEARAVIEPRLRG